MTAISRIARLAAAFAVAATAACSSERVSGPTPIAPSFSKSGTAPSGGGGGGGGTTTPAPDTVPPGPLSGTWVGTYAYAAPGTTPYTAVLSVVQSATGFSGTFTISSPDMDRPNTLEAVGGAFGYNVSLTLRAQSGRPSAPSTTFRGTLSADSTHMSLVDATSGTTIELQR